MRKYRGFCRQGDWKWAGDSAGEVGRRLMELRRYADAAVWHAADVACQLLEREKERGGAAHGAALVGGAAPRHAKRRSSARREAVSPKGDCESGPHAVHHISPYLHYVQPLLRHKRSRFSANDLCIALDRRGECERCSVRYYDEEGLALLGSAAHAFEAMRLEAEVRL